LLGAPESGGRRGGGRKEIRKREEEEERSGKKSPRKPKSLETVRVEKEKKAKARITGPDSRIMKTRSWRTRQHDVG